MGYVLQFGDIAHKRVHYYYHTYLPLDTVQLQPYLFILALFFSGACETKEMKVSTRRCPFSLSIRKSRPYAEAAMSESKNTHWQSMQPELSTRSRKYPTYRKCQLVLSKCQQLHIQYLANFTLHVNDSISNISNNSITNIQQISLCMSMTP